MEASWGNVMFARLCLKSLHSVSFNITFLLYLAKLIETSLKSSFPDKNSAIGGEGL